MKIVSTTFVAIPEYHDPRTWLDHISFYDGILERLATLCKVTSIHVINYQGVFTERNIDYHFLKLSKWEIGFPFRYCQYINNIKPDIVLVHGIFFPFHVLMLRLLVGHKVKIVAQHHAERPLRFHKRWLQKIADRFIQGYFFASHDLAKPWIELGLIRSKEKVTEVMEVSSIFYPVEEGVSIQSKKNTYLWVGRLDANKDPFTLVRGFRLFLNANPEAKLYVVFRGDALIGELASLLQQEGGSQQIVLVGPVEHDQLLPWYNKAGYILSTSHYEGSGTAVCEGMSCGCIPILSNIPSFRMMSANGSCGLLFEAGNANSLYAALVKSTLLDFTSARAKVLAQFKEKLSFEAIADTIFVTMNSL